MTGTLGANWNFDDDRRFVAKPLDRVVDEESRATRETLSKFDTC